MAPAADSKSNISDLQGLAEGVFQDLCSDPAVVLANESGAVEAGTALVRKHWRSLFSEMLEGWSLDESAWPEDRSLKMFWAWFDVQVATSTLDLGSKPLTSEE